MFPRVYSCIRLLLLVVLIASCSIAPASTIPTSTFTQPVQRETETSTVSPSPTLEPTLTPAPLPEEAKLQPAQEVKAYPGPEHYAGDVLSFEIPSDNGVIEDVTVSMTLDDREPLEVYGTSSWNYVLLPLALDTTHLIGEHTVKFQSADANVHAGYTFEVRPADQRPANETRAQWTTTQTDCCTFHYITETAAARDIDFISGHFQQAAEDFESMMQETIDSKMAVYILDRIWGNGGFGGNGQLVISYTDRYYGPTMGSEGLETLARHEFSHAAGIGVPVAGSGVEFNYEGLAVYIAGGHYKPEPLDQRGAALYDLGYYVHVNDFLPQHELAYLYPAAMLMYMAETYGTEKMWTFLGTDDNLEDDLPGSLEGALQSALGVSLQEFDQGFEDWLESKAPGEQLDDLRLTIELQDMRRQYQELYSPPPQFLLAAAQDAAARPEYLPIVIREADAPANIAVELIIANAQQAIIDGDYIRAEEFNKILADILSNGNLGHPVAREYLEVVLAAAAEGYEVVDLEIQEDRASARVNVAPPILIDLNFQKIDGTWQIQP
jgi:hypothetical protein